MITDEIPFKYLTKINPQLFLPETKLTSGCSKKKSFLITQIKNYGINVEKRNHIKDSF
jgi:hypothetical protein